MNETSFDIAALRAAYRAGARTPVDLMRAVLARIAAAGDDHVWISRFDDGALLAAAEALGPSDPGLPLWGIPFAVKDNIDVAGLPTTAACPAFSYAPTESAPVVARLLAAGALCIGKTNLDQFATGLVGARSPYGTARNPFDAAMAPGGSSSGSAVAVAAGLVSFALGTDTAGSGRVPAAFNNIVGLKPTRGLLSTRGLAPACRSLDCISVFALTVDDAVAVTELMAGADEEDAYSRAAPAGFDLRFPGWSGGFRVGVPCPEQRRSFGDAEAEALFDAAIARAIAMGGTLVEVDFAPWIQTAALLYGPWTAERTAAIETLLQGRPEALHPVTRIVIERGVAMTAVETFRAQYRLSELAGRIRPMWSTIDFLLVPTTGTAYTLAEIAADPIGRNSDLGFYTNFTNLLDLSAIAVPSGFTRAGFPVGVTLLGPAWADGLLANFARELQRRADTGLGATGHRLPAAAPATLQRRRPSHPVTEIVVFGAHLSGQPLNPDLVRLGGVLRRSCRTAPLYRMRAVPGLVERPAVAHVGSADGVALEGEVWTLPADGVAAFLAQIGAPLGLGTVILEDGVPTTGFICDGSVPAEARDISGFGGWRAYRDSKT